MPRSPRFAVSLALGFAALSSHAADRHIFRGGENDGAVLSGATVIATNDIGLVESDLTGSGGVTYFGGVSNPGSTLSYNFNGTGSLRGAVDQALSPSASFAMELWFNVDSVGFPQGLIYNGNTGTTGIGLYLFQGKLQGLRGGIAFDNTNVAPQTGVWNHAALVYDAGSISIFLNGSPIYSETEGEFTPVNTSGTDRIVLGSNNVGDDDFVGSIDEARIFTFAPGTFTTALLHYPVTPIPEPASFGALAGVATLGLAATRRRPRPLARLS